MSREYVQKRLKQLGVESRPKGRISALPKQPEGKEILWSLSAGCWMLCDLRKGTGERLTEVK
jgi:hypothetical protein